LAASPYSISEEWILVKRLLIVDEHGRCIGIHVRLLILEILPCRFIDLVHLEERDGTVGFKVGVASLGNQGVRLLAGGSIFADVHRLMNILWPLSLDLFDRDILIHLVDSDDPEGDGLGHRVDHLVEPLLLKLESVLDALAEELGTLGHEEEGDQVLVRLLVENDPAGRPKSKGDEPNEPVQPLQFLAQQPQQHQIRVGRRGQPGYLAEELENELLELDEVLEYLLALPALLLLILILPVVLDSLDNEQHDELDDAGE